MSSNRSRGNSRSSNRSRGNTSRSSNRSRGNSRSSNRSRGNSRSSNRSGAGAGAATGAGAGAGAATGAGAEAGAGAAGAEAGAALESIAAGVVNSLNHSRPTLLSIYLKPTLSALPLSITWLYASETKLLDCGGERFFIDNCGEELRREGGKSLLAFVKGVDPYLIYIDRPTTIRSPEHISGWVGGWVVKT